MNRTLTRPALLLVAIAVFAAGARAQSLAELLPAKDVVLYAKLIDPIGDFERLSGNSDVWAAPKKTASKTRTVMSEGFKQIDKQHSLEDGKSDTWLSSIGSIEFALFSLNFGSRDGEDSAPSMPDFAAAFESPLAVEMYNQMASMLADNGTGTRNASGQIVISAGAGMSPVMMFRDTRVFIASDEGRMNRLTAAMKSGQAGSLAGDTSFRTVCADGKGPRSLYVRVPQLLGAIRNNLSDSGQKKMQDYVKPLGLDRLDCLGYHEEGANGLVLLKGDPENALFALMKAAALTPTLHAALPADTAFSFGHTGDAAEQVKRLAKFLTDAASFPMAPTVNMGLTGLGMKFGVTPEALTAAFKEGMSVALVPGANGRLDQERSVIIAAKVSAKADVDQLFARLQKSVPKYDGQLTAVQTTENGQMWLRLKRTPADGAESRRAPTGGTPAPAPAPAAPAAPERQAAPASRQAPKGGDIAPPSRPSSRRSVRFSLGTDNTGVEIVDPDNMPPDYRGRSSFGRRRDFTSPAEALPIAVWDGQFLVVGWEVPVMKTLASLNGKAAQLGTTGAFDRLPKQASVYTTASLKEMFAGSSEMTVAFSALKGIGVMGSAAWIEGDTMTIAFNRAPGQMPGLLATAGMMGESDRDARTAVQDKLNEVGQRAKAFHEQKKEWPKSMADLGYPADKPLAIADSDGKLHDVVFLPPKATDANVDSWRVMLAYWDCTEFGHIVVNIEGYASRWSENDFTSAFTRYNTLK